MGKDEVEVGKLAFVGSHTVELLVMARMREKVVH